MELWKRNLRILWCTQVISLASFGFGVPFIPLYIRELEVLSPDEVKLYASMLMAAPAILMGVMAPIWGFLADKYGRKLMIMRAMIGAIFLITGMGLVHSVNQLLVLRIAQGFFTGTVTASMAFVSSNTPEKHLSYALGVISSSNLIGYSLGPALGGICAEVYGYRMSFFIGGFLMFIGTMLVLFFVKEDKSFIKDRTERASLLGGYKKILTPIIIAVLISILCLRITRALFSPFMPLFIESKLASKDGVSLITGIVNAIISLTTALASIFIGKFVASHSKVKTMLGLFLFSLLFSILLMNYENIAELFGISNTLIVFIVLYIFLYLNMGGINPILSTTAAQNVSADSRGALSGLQGMIGSIGWALAPLISGAIVYGRSVEYVLYALPVMMLINISLSLLLGRIQKR